ncbi:MAG: protein of unknown function DUF323 [Parcubacteria bacterium C7867-002]|nr:MAG: protein of unknown function DUF323 [Parcubacteria bacterium C7867-002]
MKGKTLTVMGGLVALITLMSFGQNIDQHSTQPVDTVQSVATRPTTGKIGLGRMLAKKSQEAAQRANAVIPTASETLARIENEISTGKFPAGLYPPGFLDWLDKMGNQPIYVLAPFDPAFYALKPGDRANMAYLDAMFTMGSPTSESERGSDEGQHTAVITYGFFMSQYEVTQSEYLAVVGSNPSWFRSANGYTDDLNRPVENVTWLQASNYCYLLTQQERANGHIQSTWEYRLPTEAEWEYSARANSSVLYSQTDDSDSTTGNPGPWYPGDWQHSDVFPSSGVTDVYVKVSKTSGSGQSVFWDMNSCSDGNHILNFGPPPTDGLPHLLHWHGGSPIGLNSCNYGSSYFYTGSGALTVYGKGSGTSLRPYIIMLGQAGSTFPAFSFGNSIRGGDANFDTHYEYDASVGTVNVGSPTVAPLGITAVVGSYNDNGFGLFDIQGNVSEWCQDWYGSYGSGTVIDSKGPSSGSTRVIRGGSWTDQGVACRSAERSSLSQSSANSHVGFRVVLAPVVPEWKTAITTLPSQPTYGNYPVKGSGKDNLVFATHGWTLKLPLAFSPPDPAWVDGMSNSIAQFLTANSLATWQVHGYRWVQNSWTKSPMTALHNAKQEGEVLGTYIAAQGWTHVHLISHSAGAALIQAICQRIKAMSPTTTVQCTFLDPFVGTDYAGLTDYGLGADWADSYFSRDGLTGGEIWPLTEGVLDNAYNVDVTQLDPNKVGTTRFRSSASGQMETCYKTLSSHGWPVDFYANTVSGSVSSEYAGFGFPLSKEGGNWNYALANYTPGNSTPHLLGTADPTCTTDMQVTPPSYLNTVPNFSQWPTIESDTGTIQKYSDYLRLVTGSPAWLATVIQVTNPVNIVSFNAEFTSGSGAQGLLSVLWDAETIGTVDERVVGSSLQHYEFTFPNTSTNTTHVLGFRIDSFTNIQSTLLVTNVVLNQIGPSQPFSLAVTTSRTNGLIVHELSGEAGFTYGIQASQDLINWTNIVQLANTNGTVRFFDQSSTNYPIRFYRAVTP